MISQTKNDCHPHSLFSSRSRISVSSSLTSGPQSIYVNNPSTSGEIPSRSPFVDDRFFSPRLPPNLTPKHTLPPSCFSKPTKLTALLLSTELVRLKESAIQRLEEKAEELGMILCVLNDPEAAESPPPIVMGSRKNGRRFCTTFYFIPFPHSGVSSLRYRSKHTFVRVVPSFLNRSTSTPSPFPPPSSFPSRLYFPLLLINNDVWTATPPGSKDDSPSCTLSQSSSFMSS